MATKAERWSKNKYTGTGGFYGISGIATKVPKTEDAIIPEKTIQSKVPARALVRENQRETTTGESRRTPEYPYTFPSLPKLPEKSTLAGPGYTPGQRPS